MRTAWWAHLRFWLGIGPSPSHSKWSIWITSDVKYYHVSWWPGRKSLTYSTGWQRGKDGEKVEMTGKNQKGTLQEPETSDRREPSLKGKREKAVSRTWRGCGLKIGPLPRSYPPWYSNTGFMANWPKGIRETYQLPTSPPSCPFPLDKPKRKPEDRESRRHRIPDLRSASSSIGLGGRVSTDV